MNHKGTEGTEEEGGRRKVEIGISPSPFPLL